MIYYINMNIRDFDLKEIMKREAKVKKVTVAFRMKPSEHE
jgi:hypothetical protein